MDIYHKYYLILFLFGVAYATLVYFVDQYTEGYTALEVVFGCGVVLLVSSHMEAVIGHITTQQIFWNFAAAGLPMTVGDIAKHIYRRRNGRKVVLSQIGGDHDDQAP